MFRSIKFKLITYFSVIIVLVSISLGFISMQSSTSALKKSVDAALLESSKSYGMFIEAEVNNLLGIINNISEDTIIKTGDLATKEAVISERKKINNIFSDIFIVNKTGQVISSSGNIYNPDDKLYYKEALKGNSYFSNLIENKATGEFHFFVSSPIKNNGVEGVLVGVLEAGYFSNFIAEVGTVLSGGSLVAYENDGYIVGSYDNEEVINRINVFQAGEESAATKLLKNQ